MRTPTETIRQEVYPIQVDVTVADSAGRLLEGFRCDLRFSYGSDYTQKMLGGKCRWIIASTTSEIGIYIDGEATVGNHSYKVRVSRVFRGISKPCDLNFVLIDWARESGTHTVVEARAESMT